MIQRGTGSGRESRYLDLFDKELPPTPPTMNEIISTFSKYGNGDIDYLLLILRAKQVEEDRISSIIQSRLHYLAQHAQHGHHADHYTSLILTPSSVSGSVSGIGAGIGNGTGNETGNTNTNTNSNGITSMINYNGNITTPPISSSFETPRLDSDLRSRSGSGSRSRSRSRSRSGSACRCWNGADGEVNGRRDGERLPGIAEALESAGRWDENRNRTNTNPEMDREERGESTLIKINTGFHQKSNQRSYSISNKNHHFGLDEEGGGGGGGRGVENQGDDEDDGHAAVDVDADADDISPITHSCHYSQPLSTLANTAFGERERIRGRERRGLIERETKRTLERDSEQERDLEFKRRRYSKSSEEHLSIIDAEITINDRSPTSSRFDIGWNGENRLSDNSSRMESRTISPPVSTSTSTSVSVSRSRNDDRKRPSGLEMLLNAVRADGGMA